MSWPGSSPALVRDVPDYPQPGVVFKDIAPLLGDGKAFHAVIEGLAALYGPVDKVAGIEARGFILAAPVACRLGAGFVPIRKKGKLPGVTFAQDYELEYGTATLEVQADAFQPSRSCAGHRRRPGHRGHRPGHGRPGPALGRAGGGPRGAARAVLPGGRAKLADLPVTALVTV